MFMCWYDTIYDIEEVDILCSREQENTAGPWFIPVCFTPPYFNTPWHILVHTALVFGVTSWGTAESVHDLWHRTRLGGKALVTCFGDCVLTVVFKAIICDMLLCFYVTLSNWVINVKLRLIVVHPNKRIAKDKQYWIGIQCNKLAWKRWMHFWCLLYFDLASSTLCTVCDNAEKIISHSM